MRQPPYSNDTCVNGRLIPCPNTYARTLQHDGLVETQNKVNIGYECTSFETDCIGGENVAVGMDDGRGRGDAQWK
jgi:hypothetical protein